MLNIVCLKRFKLVFEICKKRIETLIESRGNFEPFSLTSKFSIYVFNTKRKQVTFISFTKRILKKS